MPGNVPKNRRCPPVTALRRQRLVRLTAPRRLGAPTDHPRVSPGGFATLFPAKASIPEKAHSVDYQFHPPNLEWISDGGIFLKPRGTDFGRDTPNLNHFTFGSALKIANNYDIETMIDTDGFPINFKDCGVTLLRCKCGMMVSSTGTTDQIRCTRCGSDSLEPVDLKPSSTQTTTGSPRSDDAVPADDINQSQYQNP